MGWSKSKLKTFRNCSYLYKLQYIDKIPQEVVEVTNKGIILHDFFDNFYKNWNGDINKTFIFTMKQMNITEEFYNQYKEHFDNFINFNIRKLIQYPTEFMPVFTEKKYFNGEWTGIVDRVDKVGNKIIVLDYKTTSGTELSEYLDELCLYANLIEQNEKVKPTHVGIFYTGNNALVMKKLETGEVEEMFSGLETEKKLYEAQIEKGIFTTNQGVWCSWCGYKKLCPLLKRD
jgi:hypothetical protein